MPEVKTCKHYYHIETTFRRVNGHLIQRGTCTRCGAEKSWPVVFSDKDIYKNLSPQEQAEFPERYREAQRQKFLFSLGVFN